LGGRCACLADVTGVPAGVAAAAPLGCVGPTVGVAGPRVLQVRRRRVLCIRFTCVVATCPGVLRSALCVMLEARGVARAVGARGALGCRKLRIVACRVWRARCEPAPPSLLCLRPVDERAPSGDGEFGRKVCLLC
jgi:hypothetical protein